MCSSRVPSALVLRNHAERVGSAESQRNESQRNRVKQAQSRSQTEIRIISAWGLSLAACPLHRWLHVCLVPAELRVSVWCQLGTDARDSLYLALNGRMLRARYTSPAFRLLLPVRSHRSEIPTTSWDVAKKAKICGVPDILSNHVSICCRLDVAGCSGCTESLRRE